MADYRSTMPMADLQLVRDYLAGDPAARRSLAERLRCVGRILGALSRRLVRPLQDSDLADLAQETQVLVLQKLPTYEGRATLETWSFRFCSLQLMNHVRRRTRQPRAVSSELAAELPAEDVPLREDDELAGYLKHLAPREAEVVRLRHVEQLTMEEAAAALQVSASSVKTHYYRALDKLRVALGARGDSAVDSGQRDGGAA